MPNENTTSSVSLPPASHPRYATMRAMANAKLNSYRAIILSIIYSIIAPTHLYIYGGCYFVCPIFWPLFVSFGLCLFAHFLLLAKI